MSCVYNFYFSDIDEMAEMLISSRPVRDNLTLAYLESFEQLSGIIAFNYFSKTKKIDDKFNWDNLIKQPENEKLNFFKKAVKELKFTHPEFVVKINSNEVFNSILRKIRINIANNYEIEAQAETLINFALSYSQVKTAHNLFVLNGLLLGFLKKLNYELVFFINEPEHQAFLAKTFLNKEGQAKIFSIKNKIVEIIVENLKFKSSKFKVITEAYFFKSKKEKVFVVYSLHEDKTIIKKEWDKYTKQIEKGDKLIFICNNLNSIDLKSKGISKIFLEQETGNYLVFYNTETRKTPVELSVINCKNYNNKLANLLN